MKRLWVTLFLYFILISAWSQSPVNLGLKFGTNSSSLISNIDEFFDQSDIDHYLAGAFVRVKLGKLYFQPEVYFNAKGGIISSINSISLETTDISEVFSFQTIDIPFLLGYNIIDKPIFNFRVMGGPVLSYVTLDPIIEEIKNLNINDLKDNFLGIQLGIGFDLWFLTIDARVENSFNIFIDNSNYSADNRVFLLSAGIKLF